MAACGQATGPSTSGDPTGGEQPPGTEATTSTSAPASSTTTQPPPIYLDPTTVLLTTVEFGPPWDESHRSELRPGYDPGPNQTDCAAFAAYDAFSAQPTAAAAWWRDGFNLNHHAFAYETPIAAQDAINAAGHIIDACQFVSWLEGGSFTVEPLPLDGRAVGIELVEGTGEVQWVAFMQRGNVVTRLQVISFGAAPLERARDLDGFAALVATAADRLERAPLTSDPATTTTLTTTRPPIITSPPPPTIPATRNFERSLFYPLLLDAADIASGAEVEQSLAYSGEGEIENCPPSESFSTLMEWMLLEASFEVPDEWSGGHLVGFPGGQVDPTDDVRRVAEFATCDLSDFDDLTITSGRLDELPAPVTAASYFTAGDGAATLVVAFLSTDDDIVAAFSYATAGQATTADLRTYIDAFLARVPRFATHVEECTRASLLFAAGNEGPEVAILPYCDGIHEYLAAQLG